MTETMGGNLAQQALALVAAPSETGCEHPAIDLIASWLAPVADEVDRWVTPMSELEMDPAYPGREVERDEVPVVAARSATGAGRVPRWCSPDTSTSCRSATGRGGRAIPPANSTTTCCTGAAAPT